MAGKPRTSTAPAENLDALLTTHRSAGVPLTVAEQIPEPPTAVSAFVDEVRQVAPSWVLLPVPPSSRDAARRRVAALRRRGLEAVVRPHPDDAKASAVWTRLAPEPATDASVGHE